MSKRKPRMTVAFVAEQLAAEYPDVYCEFSDFMRKKRLIGLVNAAMSTGALAWFMHRGQRRIAGDALDAFLAANASQLDELAAVSRAVRDQPGRDRPILDRYPLPTFAQGKSTRRPSRDASPSADMGPSLGEID